MSVTFLRAYSGFASGATATLPADTEAALVVQGLALYATTAGVNPAASPPPTSGAITAGTYGPAVVTSIPMGGTAITGYETNGVAQTAWVTNITEIFVPHWNTWTGASYLNGTGVGTDTSVLWLFNSNGMLIQNSAIAGTTNAAGASTWEDAAFTVPVTLSPGRYFLGLQLSGATVTARHVITAFGAAPRGSIIVTVTSYAAALAVFKAAAITVPTTYTTAVAPIMRLYS